jgi:transposase-like protein
LQGPAHPRTRVINVYGHPSFLKVVAEPKQERRLGRRCHCRTCPYLNNNLEQDHRAIKRRIRASQGLRSFDSVWQTIQGYEVLPMIRKGRVRWLPNEDVIGHVLFVNATFGLKTA